MTAPRRGSLLAVNTPTMSPVFVHWLRIAAVVWTALLVVATVATWVLSTRLPATIWFLWLGGRGGPPHADPTPVLALLISVASFAAAALILDVLVAVLRGTGRTVVIVVLLLVIALATIWVPDVVLCCALQLRGTPPDMTAAMALLDGPAQLGGFVGAPLWIITCLLLPAMAARRRSASRRSSSGRRRGRPASR